ncbi:MAG: peptidylprolyl isomerase [Erysipelotrichaceae bacterium]|jgi:peptidyl-prolyl cis-trans isomerase B (cyclophilin B)|nr:peptidylprolyl isomerase [Erysipelotrichaceae bacterium]
MKLKTKAFLAAMAAVVLLGCGPAAADETSAQAEFAENELIRETVYVEMDIKDYGKVKLELDGETAPITVTNFVNLVNKGFYDGLTFHRIMDGFMVQGGDPQGDGYGGSGKTIKGEFSQNGVENNISHTTGTISMARGAYDMDSASSQFFICVADDIFLDGNYAAFGHVTEGMDAILQIAKDAKPLDDNGTIDKKEQPVINSIKVVEG